MSGCQYISIELTRTYDSGLTKNGSPEASSLVTLLMIMVNSERIPNYRRARFTGGRQRQTVMCSFDAIAGPKANN